VGRALLEGEPVDVQSEGGFLAEGVPVEVVRVDSNRLVVKEVEERGEGS
jgi:membrane-bound ClpP family serine protease